MTETRESASSTDPRIVASALQIVEVIGYDAALALIARYGGITLQLAEHPSARDLVVQAIGADGALRLLKALGSGPLTVPRAIGWLLARRDEEICTRAGSGETRSELALRFGITERHVYNILAAARRRDEP